MIRNSRQNWIVGHNVKVGFLTLKVRARIETPGDWKPDAYILSNLDGDKLYSFVPHNGLIGISTDKAKIMLNEQARIDQRRQAEDYAHGQMVDAVNKVFA